MGILHSFALELEAFTDILRLPDVRATCPSSCPCCGNPTYPPGGTLGVIGHGTYRRQVIGVGLGRSLLIFVRRYLCKACRRTFAVLPDDLLASHDALLDARIDALVDPVGAGEAADSLLQFWVDHRWEVATLLDHDGTTSRSFYRGAFVDRLPPECHQHRVGRYVGAA